MPTTVKGALELRKALRQFTPDLAKETSKEIGNFLKPVVKNARGFVPSNSEIPSGWLVGNQKGKWERVAFDSAVARRGIGYKTTPSRTNRSGFRALVSLINKSAAGAIYETAGRKSGITGQFTPRLQGSLVGRSQKMQGRAMFKAWDQDQGKAKDAVLKAIFNSAQKLNKRATVSGG
jgi:hypothetical protein